MAPFVLVAFSALIAASQPADAAFADNINAIKAGAHGCPHCMLAGADLSNQCLQGSDFSSADLDKSRLRLTCLSGANLANATLRGADLSGANLRHANLTGADFTGAILTATSFKGTDLTRARGLTQVQLDAACGDAATKAPSGLTLKTCN